ncbi:elongation factor Ts [PVC group bacterium]|nr:elongation factor Ts [PVC group bacterium]
MSVNAATVKELRDKTNIGFMDCKEALKQTNGNIDEAVIYLRKKGIMKADARAGRAAKEGRIEIALNHNKDAAYIIEVNCETDFVARNEKFVDFVTQIKNHIIKNDPSSLDELLSQNFNGDSTQTVSDAVKSQIATIGENIVLKKLIKVSPIEPNSLFQIYIHAGSKLGVIVEGYAKEGSIDNDLIKGLLKDVAMHIAASSPQYIRPDNVPDDLIEKEKDIFSSQIDPKKPDNIKEKIIAGKVAKMLNTICLLKQPYVKNPDITIEEHLTNESSSLGTPIEISQFHRMQLGD